MSYQEIVSLDADVTIALGGKNKKTGKNNPSEVEGYYLGARKVESKKARNGFAYIHFFQTAEGNIGVWGKTDLDRKLLSVTPGTMTLASFDRMQPTPNGEMYKYKVAVDSDNTIVVSTLLAGAGNEALATGADDSDDVEQDDDVVNDDDTAQALAAAERQARVQALLNKGKNTSAKK